MHSLRELQLDFSRDVFSDGSTGFGAHIQAHGLSGDRRLQIYRNNTYVGFSNSLQNTYPVVLRLVGDGFFRYAAHRCISEYPSTSGDLNEFGESFPAFLANFEPAAELSYLPDVAALEWAYERVFYGAEHALLDIAALAQVPQERHQDLKFTLNPASRLLKSDYPILSIWQVNQKDYEGDEAVDLSAGGVKLLVIRNTDLDVEIKRLQEGEFVLLRAFADGQHFAVACEQALESQPDFDVPSCFQRHILQGTLVDFSL